MFSKIFAVLAATLLLAGCNATAGTEKKEIMVASWYMHGTRTANGEKFNPDGMTAAHKTLPFNTKIKLTHREKSVIVRINDRGPFIKGRHIDISRGVAKALGCGGICRLETEIVEAVEGNSQQPVTKKKSRKKKVARQNVVSK